MAHSKPTLPTKICTTCGRPFSWRKRWRNTWENVRYCSKACSAKRGGADKVPQPAGLSKNADGS